MTILNFQDFEVTIENTSFWDKLKLCLYILGLVKNVRLKGPVMLNVSKKAKKELCK